MNNAIRDTFDLLYLRWNMLRNAKSKVFIWLGVLTIAVAVLMASYAGSAIKMLAASPNPNAEVARKFAITYLESFLRGELGSLVATTLGLAIISVMIAPFTGASSTSLISHYHLVSVRSSERHRFTDSIVTQLFSSISLLQLITLTAVGSLLTLDKGRIEGILYAWISWPVLIVLSTFFIWLAEYLYRKVGERKRLVMLFGALAVVGLAVLIDPAHGSTVFGIGTSYAFLIQNFYSFSFPLKFLSLLILFVIFVGLLFFASLMCKKALSQPEIHTAQLKAAQKKVRVWKTSSSPFVEATHVVIMQIWRNLEIRKPLILVTLFGAGMIFFGKGVFSVMATMILIVPLVSSLSWGSNVFGILGNGYVWISSNPRIRNNIIWIFAGIQITLSVGLFVLMCLPAIIAGQEGTEGLAGAVLAVISTSFLMTRSALDKSVHTPFEYKAGFRGESPLPPATMLSYTIRFALWSGMYGFIVVIVSSIMIQLGLAFLAIVWSIFRLNRLNNKFLTDATLQNKIVYTIGND